MSSRKNCERKGSILKINQSDLGKIYTNYLKDRRGASSELCPSNEDLILWLRSKLPKRKKNRITDHIVNCLDCAQEAKWLLERIRKENGIIYEIKQHIDADNAEQLRKTRVPARRFSWKIVSFTSTVMLLAAIATFSVFYFSSKSGTRRGVPSDLVLVSPVDKFYTAGGLKFVWKGLPNAKYYVVDVFNASFVPIWRSDTIFLNEAIPSKDMLHKLVPKESYYWMVTAILKNEAEVKSKLKEFRIKE